MTEPTQADLDAARIVFEMCDSASFSLAVGGIDPTPKNVQALQIRRIALAIAAAREAGRQSALPPANHILDSAGVVRRVCGLLPSMACGSVYAHHSRYDPPVWAIDSTGTVVPAAVSVYESHNMFFPSECYSTRAAAEAARAAGGWE